VKLQESSSFKAIEISCEGERLDKEKENGDKKSRARKNRNNSNIRVNEMKCKRQLDKC